MEASCDGRSERFADLAADLARAKPDVIVTRGTPATRAAKDIGSIPVVMAASADPVGYQWENYSWRKATIGSTRVARCAGRYDAKIATPIKTAETEMNVVGSLAPTPYRRCEKLDSSRVRIKAAVAPIARPTTASRRP